MRIQIFFGGHLLRFGVTLTTKLQEFLKPGSYLWDRQNLKHTSVIAITLAITITEKKSGTVSFLLVEFMWLGLSRLFHTSSHLRNKHNLSRCHPQRLHPFWSACGLPSLYTLLRVKPDNLIGWEYKMITVSSTNKLNSVNKPCIWTFHNQDTILLLVCHKCKPVLSKLLCRLLNRVKFGPCPTCCRDQQYQRVLRWSR